MKIRNLKPNENPPMKLLLLADPSKRIVKEYLKRGTCVVAVCDGNIVGEYVLLPTRPETAELVNVAVTEAFHGQGIGKQLVTHAIQTARIQGFKTIEVGTGNAGIGQLALYQKCGFRIIGVDFDFFLRHYSEEIYENGIQCRDMIRMTLDL